MCYTYLVNGNNGSDAVQRQPLLHGWEVLHGILKKWTISLISSLMRRRGLREGTKSSANVQNPAKDINAGVSIFKFFYVNDILEPVPCGWAFFFLEIKNIGYKRKFCFWVYNLILKIILYILKTLTIFIVLVIIKSKKWKGK